MADLEHKKDGIGAGTHHLEAEILKPERPAVTSTFNDADSPEEKAVRRKVDRHLLPVLCIMVMVSFLDRTNIGNARIEGMTGDLHLEGHHFNIALFVFFIPYVLLDVPANVVMRKSRPSWFLCSLMFAWGVVTICAGLTQSFAGLVVCRLLLGACEAGFYPGGGFLLTMYYTRHDLHTRMSTYYTSALIANAFGGLLAYAIAFMDGIGGYGGWRWIFIIEGLVTVVVAVCCVFVLPDWPEQAKFLTAREKDVLLSRLERDVGEYVEDKSSWTVFKESLLDPKQFFCALMYFGCAATANSAGFFFPTILKELGWTSSKAQYMSIPIWLTAFVVAVISGKLSDHYKHRYAFAAVGFLVTTIGYSILRAGAHVSVSVRYMACFFVPSGNFVAQAISITWLNNNIVGKKRRGISVALLMGLGNTGALLGANVFLQNEAPYYRSGYDVMLGLTLLGLVSATACYVYLWHENEQKRKGKRDYLLSLPSEELLQLGERHPSFKFTC